MTYDGPQHNEDKKNIYLIGKGITYDTVRFANLRTKSSIFTEVFGFKAECIFTICIYRVVLTLKLEELWPVCHETSAVLLRWLDFFRYIRLFNYD